ncbi:MAG: twin-arginine translocase subunit TatC [Solirubrobacteraceae bacterium]
MPNAIAALRAVRAIGHDQQLSVVGHLDELRTRLIVSLIAIAIAFGLCFWQNNALLTLINRPLSIQTQQQVKDGHGPLGATYTVQERARDIAVQLDTVVAVLRTPSLHLPHAGQALLAHAGIQLAQDIKRLSTAPGGDKPITLGIGEPFTTTVTVSLIFALILALPVVLLEAYGFMIPALEPDQRRLLRPLITAIPLLFIVGVVFGYYVVLPAAVHFFQNFNSGQFNVLVQAAPYYKFAATTLLAMGIVFQVPVGVLAVTRAGLITPQRLRKSRRWAIVACGAVAALIPGDAVTLLLETVPLYLLFEVSVLIATVVDRRARRAMRNCDVSVTGLGGP